MDNNFYKILESFKRVTEGGMKDMLWDLSNRMDREQFIEYTTSEMGFDADEVAEFWDKIHGPLDETFTGYWKGTDAGTPGKKMVGASEGVETECDAPMSLTDKLKARWEQTKQEKGLVEVGMTTGGMSGMTTGGPQATSANTQDGQEIDTITKNLQNLKSKVPDINIQKATAALSKADDSNPLSSQDKDAASALADPVANLIKDKQLGQQLKQLIDKGMQKDQAAAQLAKQQGGV
jgi:hypothetical protein